ncbi:DUF2069 domain-containing protein [Motilimonas sp. KMU-193]|uniref:DUF2069 domain-containing protein n=1 Tax=Motilimonas sp. KMU-193 TaxID=3388668 RepID=UPI00396B0035
MQTQTYRKIAQLGYFSLMAYVLMWHLWLSPPPEGISLGLMLGLWFVPLLFPLRGILRGNPYTYAWASFISLWYFLHSLTIIVADENERWLAVVELLLASTFFYGCVYYAKYRGRELGLSIRKPKQPKSPK